MRNVHVVFSHLLDHVDRCVDCVFPDRLCGVGERIKAQAWKAAAERVAPIPTERKERPS